MKTQCELLELAAKAAGLRAEWSEYCNAMELPDKPNGQLDWNPLTDDGDALRLAVKLGIGLEFVSGVLVITSTNRAHEDARDHGDDLAASTRLAITRAAAAIGEAMP